MKRKKFHFLLHLPDNIVLFGPPRLYATEKFESYNAVMRNVAMHTNRQAPSRDIAIKFSKYQSIRHLVSGGFWQDENGKWITAGKEVKYLLKDDTVKRIFGVPNAPEKENR